MARDAGKIETPVNADPLGGNFRVVYQSIVRHGAVGIIERGFMSGYREAGAELREWDSEKNSPPLENLLAEFHPTHFCCSLQTPRRENAAWMNGRLLTLLRSYKRQNGLRVVANSFPGNLGGILRRLDCHHAESRRCRSGIVLQPASPTKWGGTGSLQDRVC